MPEPTPPGGEDTGLKIFSFILHVWRERAKNRSVWRGSLTDVTSGERRHFQSLKDLIKKLSELIGGNEPSRD
ncbi:MAG: hypothetical protein IT314_08300 [Anaerolineales bacterium]|nr:hypothetical protein [Anaerolineales bacterium]